MQVATQVVQFVSLQVAHLSSHGCGGTRPSLAKAHAVLAKCCGRKRGSCVNDSSTNAASHRSGGCSRRRASAHSVLEQSCC